MMDRANLPLNALRAFEAASRHLSFTMAARELCVSQTALSHQIKALEVRLGFALFRRLPRGVALTDEGAAIAPTLTATFDRIGAALDQFAGGRYQEVVTMGVVATFASGWLIPRLPDFAARHPGVDLRIMTHNNRIDQAGEGMDLVIRFGDGHWHGLFADAVMDAPLSLLCAPAMAAQIQAAPDVAALPLLRSYRADEWPRWFGAAGMAAPALRGPIFDTSLAIARAAAAGLGAALLPAAMFADELRSGALVRPLEIDIVTGRYWLTRLSSRPATAGMRLVQAWLAEAVARSGSGDFADGQTAL